MNASTVYCHQLMLELNFINRKEISTNKLSKVPGQEPGCSLASLIEAFNRSQVRLLDRIPPPQFFEHSDQGLQGDHCSVTGHSWRLQNSITVDGPGQGFPSSSSGFPGFPGSWDLGSGIRQVLERCVVPPPQLLLQLDHSPQPVHSGSFWHGSSLQLELSLLSPRKERPIDQTLSCLRGKGVMDQAAALSSRGPEFDPCFFQIFFFFLLGIR